MVFILGVNFGEQKLVKKALESFLRSWAHDICSHHGQALHSQARQGRLPRPENRHLPHGRVITNDHRNRRPTTGAGEHSTTKGYGLVPW
ncbi:hypothetical protein CEP52_012797 [Fusarium oligoseptatum]|uniref:Uncharacterized protein n=1 Tax=Fusarium oligoseptatum TaxID=2604345 RepID=A0A428SWM0_9HYPO|nr:hypothetical protein CEP52_012797 [Fusarium oligoseptatum]